MILLLQTDLIAKSKYKMEIRFEISWNDYGLRQPQLIQLFLRLMSMLSTNNFHHCFSIDFGGAHNRVTFLSGMSGTKPTRHF